MQTVLQPANEYSCGQCCIATLLGLSLDEAKALIGKRGSTTTRDLASVIRSRGFRVPVSRVVCTPRRQPTLDCLLFCRYQRWNSWMLHWRGVVYDPFGLVDGTDLDRVRQVYRIKSFLPIHGVNEKASVTSSSPAPSDLHP